MTLFDLVNHFGFCDYIIDKTYMIEFFKYYFPLILYQAFMGTCIYRHFCTASVYYFSRVERRLGWYLKETLNLYLRSLLFIILLILAASLFVKVFIGLEVSEDSAYIMFYYTVIHSLWLYSMTMIVNIVSIRYGSQIGFVSVIVMHAVCMGYFVIFQNYLNSDTIPIRTKEIMIKINPISHIIIDWHSCSVNSINQKMQAVGIDFGLGESVAVCVVMAVVITIVGIFVVNRQEFVVINKETGGI